MILDEFQRFKDLLTPGTPGAQLAHAIFEQKTARVLMLSATPYKMYTLPDEPEGDDHYKDFRDTITFLAGAEQAEAVISGLATMRGGLLSGDPAAKQQARSARDDVEIRLRSVMSRTERGRSSQDRDGMLSERSFGFELTPEDLLAYSSAQRVVSCLPGRAGHLRVLALLALRAEHHGELPGQAEARRRPHQADARAAVSAGLRPPDCSTGSRSRSTASSTPGTPRCAAS